MKILPRDKQIEVIATLCDGLGIRATSRITGVDRGTVASLALRVGRGCAELHDRMMVGLRVGRLQLDEAWQYVGRRRRQHERPIPGDPRGDQYTYVALASSTRAIIAYRTPAMALGVADRTWTIGDLSDAAPATQPIAPTTAPDRRSASA